MREEQSLIAEFMQRRPAMVVNNSDPKRMVELLYQEVDELNVEIEAGNVDKIAQELPDVAWFCLTIAQVYGIDLENAIWAKALRNEHKYGEEYFDGSIPYEEAHALCREMWDRNNDGNYTPDSI